MTMQRRLSVGQASVQQPDPLDALRAELMEMPARLVNLVRDTHYFPATPWKVVGSVYAITFPLLGSLVGWLVVWWLALAILELVSCYIATHVRLRSAFPWERRLVGKLMLGFLIPVAMSLDWMIYQLGAQLPGEIGATFADFLPLPVTTGSLVWMNVAEGIKVVRNIRESEGNDAIPPVIRWFLAQLQRMDRERFPDSEHATFERWTDRMARDLSDEDIRELLLRGGIIDADGRLTTPPVKEPPKKRGTDGAN